MSITFCILGSGSSGNSTYIGSGSTAILIDAGFSGRDTARRLEQINLLPDNITAICLTHEHSDHTAGLRVLCERHGIKPYANRGTIDALSVADPRLNSLNWNVFLTGSRFKIGTLTIEPFSVPHDAYDPVGFIISSDTAKLGIVTDMGMPTHLIKEKLKDCHALIVESNHDIDLLQTANRPWQVKQRIAGRQGHLCNEKAAEMICEIAGSHLTHVFLSHLSNDCNTPELAHDCMSAALKKNGLQNIDVHLSFPDKISNICNI
ncbi:MAG: MBL fold metallo-hydrolase [Lentisphaerae bacterium]|nr:MBL fold metallo-hydrolase [Lentisphaerota bacterium]